MLFHRIETEGLAHYSYLVGSGHAAVVIDPRRDCDIYLKTASKRGYQIRHILETHRNEDYLIGSVELSQRTGAHVWHADEQLDYRYGQPVKEGQQWDIGSLVLHALSTPGHTPGSMSYLLYTAEGKGPWAVFTGDALFAGEVGRVDLLGQEKIKDMAGMLFDFLFGRLLPLGDGVIVFPAHGAGSVCGSNISDRPWTTIGQERLLNPRLQYTQRGEFVAQVAVPLELPPYFRQMERWNIEGPPLLRTLPEPAPLSAREFADRAKNTVVLDTRAESFSAAHIPGALSIWLDGLASFAGWFISYDRPILLVNETDDTAQVIKYLVREGFDHIEGYLAGGILTWHKAGYDTESIKTVSVPELCRRLDAGEERWILDVRSGRELEEVGQIPGAHHIHITQLLEHFDEVPKEGPVYIFCGTGRRSMIAASLLHPRGWHNLTVVLGGFAAWKSRTCPVRPKQKAVSLGKVL